MASRTFNEPGNNQQKINLPLADRPVSGNHPPCQIRGAAFQQGLTPNIKLCVLEETGTLPDFTRVDTEFFVEKATGQVIYQYRAVAGA